MATPPLQPLFTLSHSKLGEPILNLGGKAVESSYEAKKNAAMLAQKKSGEQSIILLIGSGLGYLAQSLVELQKKVILFEPFPELFSELKKRDSTLSQRLEGVAVVFTASELTDKLKQIQLKQIQEAQKEVKTEVNPSPLQPFSLPQMIVHPGYEPYVRLEKRLVLKMLRQLYLKEEALKLSLEHAKVSERSLKAIEAIVSLPSIEPLIQHFKGCAAALICPGPSLKSCLPLLKAFQGRFIIFAAIQAVPLLQKEGIDVHFLLCPDPNDLTLFFQPCQKSVHAVLTESAAHPYSLNWLPGKTFLFHYRSDQVHQILWQQTNAPYFDEPVATVAETAVLLAQELGCRQLFCLGMDFCWQKHRYAYRAPNTVDSMQDPTEKRFFLYNSKQEIVETESAYFQAARYLSLKATEFKRKGISFYHLAEGLPITGAEPVDTLKLQALWQKLPEQPFYLPQFKQKESKKRSLARELLQKISALSRQPFPKRTFAAAIPNQKIMPFFDDLSLEERQRLVQQLLGKKERVQIAPKSAEEGI